MDVPSHAEVVAQVDSFLERHGMAPTTFGRGALGEASFVKTLRDGRLPGLQTLLKLQGFMRAKDEELQASVIGAEHSADTDGPLRLNAGAR